MYILSLLWSLKRRFRKKESDTSGKKQCQQRRGWKWDFSLVGLGPPHCALQVKCNNWNRFLDRRRMLMQSCALDVCGGSVEWTFVEPRTHSIPERIWVVSRLSIKNKFPFFSFSFFLITRSLELKLPCMRDRETIMDSDLALGIFESSRVAQ